MTGLALAVFAFQLPAERDGRSREPAARHSDAREKTRKRKASDLGRLEQYWSDRVTYPTGNFDPTWVRQAADQDALVSRSVPAGLLSQ